MCSNHSRQLETTKGKVGELTFYQSCHHYYRFYLWCAYENFVPLNIRTFSS